MILYLADEKKLNTFKLPQNIDESFLFSYIPSQTNTEVFLNIFADANFWYIKNSPEISVNQEEAITQLNTFKTYELKIKGIVSPFYLYSYPDYNENFKDVGIGDIAEISIGNDETCDIVHKGTINIQQKLLITNENGIFYINVDENTPSSIYLNKNLLKGKKELSVGDTIFIDNLKIVWMKTFMRIFLTNEGIQISEKLKSVTPTSVDNNNYLNYDMGENDKGLYTEDNYFFHKPRLTPSIETEEVEIDPPPNKELKDDIPLILQLGSGLSMIVFAGVSLYKCYNEYSSGLKTFNEILPTLLTSGAMIISSFLLPKIIKAYNKHRQKKKENIRQQKYTEYLEKKKTELNKIIKYQTQTLFDNNLSGKECFDMICGNKARLWEREIKDPDFLTVRVGIGNTPTAIDMRAPKEKFLIEPDSLIESAYAVVRNSKELQNVPITLSLSENFVSSIVCNEEFEELYMKNIISQITTLHNPKELKIVMLTSKRKENNWSYLKLFPHILSDDKSIRYFATTEEEAKNILIELEKTYNERKTALKEAKNELNEETEREILYSNYTPYYLIISDNFKKYKNIEFLNKLIDFKSNIGFSLLMVENNLRNIPNSCNKYIYVSNNSCIFQKEYNKNNQISFKPELFNDINMDRLTRELSNVPLQETSEIYNLPTSISFLEMYNVGNIEQLNILNKWNFNNPITSLQCPIGVGKSGELFKLDLHEKFHGPHGLIAGSTGSGKSEFIITYILSMAINYHPNEVQFVLIDYKGGGLAGAFENRETGVRIPHLAGTITNLDVSEMNRTLVSIESELKRRQKKFNEARDSLGESTIDIYKYQKYYREGVLKEPIPHLFIIADEFAELKSQQPEFMDELISTARIGRSLGVHLILATQKPSGVVNDQIWSNSKFKVSLKVQTRQDSMEMLKRPDAASIKETGRFYLQVGYDELFELGQSAWAGASYVPTERVVKKYDDSLSIIDNTGNIIKSINNLTVNDNSNNTKNGDQLTNIVKYINNLAIKNNIKTNRLWLDNIPEEIYLNNLIEKYNYKSTPYEIEAVIGEYDDPTAQEQGLLTLNLTKNGNVLIYGMSGSGKENLITTIVTSICLRHNTSEVNIYMLDFGAETLKKFAKFPQVGDIAFSDELEKITNLQSILTKEIEKRKELFADYMGSYENYIKESGKTIPNIVCIILGYENFIEMYGLLSEKFINLFKDGPKFGITFIITNSLATGVRSKVLQLFTNKISLQLADADAYRYVIDAPRGMRPSNHFGRGLVKLDKVLEFQTAYISKPDDINKTIKTLNDSLSNMIKTKAPKIPTLPNFLTIDKIINNKFTLQNIPVGISKNKLNLVTYDFDKNNISSIITSSVNKNIHFIYGLIELLKQIPGAKIRVIDVLKIYNNTQGVDVFNKDFDTLIKQIKIEAIKDGTRKNLNIFIIIGLGAFKNNVTDKTKKIFDDVFSKVKTYQQNKFIIYDDYNSYKTLELESWFKQNISQMDGIWLGENASTQLALKMPNLSNDERKIMFNQIGYVVKEGQHTIVRYIVDKEFDDEK